VTIKVIYVFQFFPVTLISPNHSTNLLECDHVGIESRAKNWTIVMTQNGDPYTKMFSTLPGVRLLS